MGSFSGHINPGAYFVVFGLRWTYCVLMRYYLGRREMALGKTSSRMFKNSLFYPCSIKPGIPVEACILFLATVLEFIGELVMGLYLYGMTMNGQHMTVIFFVIVASFIAILKEYRVITFPNLDYAAMILAFLVYAFIFYYHTMSTTLLETQLHIHMVQISLVLAGALVCEVLLPHSVMAACVRCLAVNLMGSWFIHIAFILYYPYYQVPWDQSNTMQLQLAVMIFLWQLAGNLFIILAVALFVSYQVRNMTPTQVHLALDITYSYNIPSGRCKKSLEQKNYLLEKSDDEEV